MHMQNADSQLVKLFSHKNDIFCKTFLCFENIFYYYLWALVSIPYARIRMETGGATRSELPHDFVTLI